ncbi:MAG: hypothetical protein HY536_01155 [Candidatus Colwellbacteria bacterium]|nr:hypothetical protein [Candidatus Colwellbacteria bacterium]
MAKNATQTIKTYITSLVGGLDDRSREVVRARYGLGSEAPVTLQVIGDRYRITRERVRQIEALSIVQLKARLNDPYVDRLTGAAVSQLERVGGVQRDSDFIKALHASLNEPTPLANFEQPARFLLKLSGAASLFRDAYSSWHPFWYRSTNDRKRAQQFVTRFTGELKKQRGAVIASRALFSDVLARVVRAARVTEASAQSYLAASRLFTTGPFGEQGLTEWAEVNPKTARDWAYLVLKREAGPLHFSELASRIAKRREGKRTNVQTVHNELIKDERFVLVGRGMYGLREAGLIPGTAREVIGYMLKTHGPLTAQEVVSRVREQRMLKEGTILINLQNRKHFKALDNGRYALHEA